MTNYCRSCGRRLHDPVSRAAGIGPVCRRNNQPRPQQLAIPTTENHMPQPTRTFTVAELTALGVPPDQPEDIQYSDHLLADEHVTTLKYSQKRRCIFRADDGRTYAVEYEAEVDSGDYEHGPGPDNHGWYGNTVEAVAVEQRPVTVLRWLPVDS